MSPLVLTSVSNEIIWVDGRLVVEFTDGSLAVFVCDLNPGQQAGCPDNFRRLRHLTKAALSAEVFAINRHAREAEQDATYRHEAAILGQAYRQTRH